MPPACSASLIWRCAAATSIFPMMPIKMRCWRLPRPLIYRASWFPFCRRPEFETLDAIKRVCERLNRAGEFAQSNGLTLGYHNHWWEFKRLEGQATLDLMLAELDDAVFLQIDTYWAQVGGLDAVEVVKRVGERAPLIHLKDGPINRDDAMLAVGAGGMPIAAVVEAAAAEWHIVELDRCDADMLQAVQDSYAYLTSNGLARGKK